jgi:aminocarboxymuconate-semialdehyde decarboxylase
MRMRRSDRLRRGNRQEEIVTNRRHFLRTVAGTVTGGYVMRRGLLDAGAQNAAAPIVRRQVSVGGRRIRVVDIHAHSYFVPPVMDVVRGTRFADEVAAKQEPLGPERIRPLDQRGIDVQVLSINGFSMGFWWYAADRDLASRIVRTQDEYLAAFCKSYPDRFVGLSSPSLQHPDLAVQQLDYAITQLGLKGAAIGGHVDGARLSDPRFHPFWARVQELGVPLFMHPNGAEHALRPGFWDGSRGSLSNTIGNPLETTIALSHLIVEGTLDRFPGVRICAAHAGGYLPSYLGRTNAACGPLRGGNCASTKLPSEYFRQQILVDTMVFSDEGLRHLVAEVGANQVLYGTDIGSSSLTGGWPDTLDIVLRSAHLSNAEKEAILGGTAARLLRI